jgi:hypothetical protein
MTTLLTKTPSQTDDWSFAHLKTADTLWGPHGYHRYPAKFIPHLVRRLIDEYSTPHMLVGDPFLGSGTTGVEALRSNRRFSGIDINPVAVLISRAKCTPLPPESVENTWKRVKTGLAGTPRIGRRLLTPKEKEAICAINIARASDEDRLRYWFPDSHRAALESILAVALALPDRSERDFYLCAFSNILKRCSIWLSGSTKPQKNLNKTLSDPAAAFSEQIEGMLRRNRLYWQDIKAANLKPEEAPERCAVSVEDARKQKAKDGIFHLVVTSPPYATCYQYIDLHQLSQLWFERHEVIAQNDLHKQCIGGSRTTHREDLLDLTISTGSSSADCALQKLGNITDSPYTPDIRQEMRALHHYFADMRASLKEVARVTARHGHLILIVGDSYRRGVTIPTSDALTELATAADFELERKIVRKIPVRVLTRTRNSKTGRFSPAAQSDTQVYPEEDILIFRRR